MSLNDKALTQTIKNLERIVHRSANILKNSADELFKITEFLKEAEKDITKLSSDDLITSKKVREPITFDKKNGISKKSKIIISQDRESLVEIRNQIYNFLDDLKSKVAIEDISLEIPTIKGVPLSDEGLDNVKEDMADLYSNFKVLMEEDGFYHMSPEDRRKALTDMAEAIKILTKEYDNS